MITDSIIEDMIRSAIFIITNVDVVIKDEKQPTYITLVLDEHDGLEAHGYAISGFPVRLLQDETPTQALRAKPSSVCGHGIQSPDLSSDPIISKPYRRSKSACTVPCIIVSLCAEAILQLHLSS